MCLKNCWNFLPMPFVQRNYWSYVYNINVHILLTYLEKEMATHSSTLAWKIPWTEEAGRLQSMGPQRVGHDWATSLHSLHSLHTLSLEKEMATHSTCLENPMDRGAWQAMVHGVAEIWTLLKWLSMPTNISTLSQIYTHVFIHVMYIYM